MHLTVETDSGGKNILLNKRKWELVTSHSYEFTSFLTWPEFWDLVRSDTRKPLQKPVYNLLNFTIPSEERTIYSITY